jgi:fused signal recognition particle receptor
VDFISRLNEAVGGAFEPISAVIGGLLALLLIVLVMLARLASSSRGKKAESAALLNRVAHLEEAVQQLQQQLSDARRDFADRLVVAPTESALAETPEEPSQISEVPSEKAVSVEQVEAPLHAVVAEAPVPEAVHEEPRVEVVSPAVKAEPSASISAGMAKTRTTFLGRLKSFFTSRASIDQTSLDELEEMLILSDVGSRCASDLVEKVKAEIQAQRHVNQDALQELLKEGIRSQLVRVDSQHPLYQPQDGTKVFLIVGVNGVGKTTTVAKLAARYREQGKSVLVVAADTFRAAAVQQLEEWAGRIGFELVKGPDGAKPASVVFDGMVKAKEGTYDVVLIDTAGRLHTKANLMQELEGIRNSIKRHIPDGPHETVLVVDGVSGQNALAQARQFNEAVALSGVVVTKLDGTPKGGIMIPISQELKIPVLYVGVGEKAKDLLPFSVNEFVDSLFEGREGASDEQGPLMQLAHGVNS